MYNLNGDRGRIAADVHKVYVWKYGKFCIAAMSRTDTITDVFPSVKCPPYVNTPEKCTMYKCYERI